MSVAPSSFPRCVYSAVFVCAALLISGPMSVVSFVPGPSRSFFILINSFSSNSFAMVWCAMILDVAVHRCPVVPYPPQSMPSTARSISASSMTMIAFFPPISSPTFFIPAVCSIVFPVSLCPVNDTTSIFGCCTSGIPVSFPDPVTKLMTPLGIPASWINSTSSSAQSGVSDDGFHTIVFPVMSAGAIFHAGIAMGKFHGVMIPAIPWGFLWV